MKRYYGKTNNAVTKVMTVRLPLDLISRIEDLAQKQLISRNAWIVHTLTKASTPKGKK